MIFDHIGIAVRNIEQSLSVFLLFLDETKFKTEVVESQGVKVVFIQVGRKKIELLEPLDEDGPVARFIGKRGEGIHHIAFTVPDIVAAMAELKKKGFQPLTEKPVSGAGNKLVCFFHPKQLHGTLIEICQPVGH